MTINKILIVLTLLAPLLSKGQVSLVDSTKKLELQSFELLDSISKNTAYDINLDSNSIIECYWTNESNNRLGIMCLPIEDLIIINLRSDFYRDTSWVVFKSDLFKSTRVYFLMEKNKNPELLSLHDYIELNDTAFYKKVFETERIVYPTSNPMWYTKYLNDEQIYTITDWDLMMYRESKNEKIPRDKSFKLD
jgi:hypothetical protein